jgi:hypothetical protein
MGGFATQSAFGDVTTRLVGDVAIITGRSDMTGAILVVGDDRSSPALRFPRFGSAETGAC